MLQSHKSFPTQDNALPVPLPEEAGVGEMVSFATGIIRRQWLLLLVVPLITIAIGAIYLAVTPPTYTAKAQIIIDRGKSSFLQQQSIVGDVPIDSAQIENQISILESERIASLTVKKLRLTEDSEFVGVGWLKGLASGILGSGEQTTSEVSLSQQATGVVLKNLEARRAGAAFIIEITYRSHSAQRAAQVANAVGDAYIEDQLDSKYQARRRASEWLKGRVEELRQQAAAAEQAVNTFKSENNIVAVGGKLINDQDVAELNSQFLISRAKTSEALARLDRIESVLRTIDLGSDLADPAGDATVSDTLSSPIITKLRQQYLELVNREADFSVRYGPRHLAVTNVRNQIRETRNSIINELKRLAETYKSDYAIAKQRQESIEKDLAASVSQSRATSKSQVTLRELESTTQSTRVLYESFLQRYNESLQQQTVAVTEGSTISPATTPREKSSPKAIIVLAISVLGGLGLGGGLGFVRDMMDRFFRTSGQVEAALQAPCVALVPLLKKTVLKRSQTPPDHRGGPDHPRVISRHAGLFWTVVDSPLSRFAEAMRSIKLAADLHTANRTNIVIGITSSLPNEGKSTTAAALAQLIAQVGYRVILIDFDLRNPGLSRTLAPNAKAGLVEVLAGEKSVEEVTWGCSGTNFAFLPAVRNSSLFHTSEILASARTKNLLAQLRQSYDYVVVDLPPLAPVVDVRATTHLMDLYFLVVEWGRTKIDIVQHALNSAPGVHQNLAGVILNKTDMDYISRYDSHRSKYYYNKYYVRYGYTDDA
jgi:succinoglycan biosynthesis transport protein ExoP